MKSEGNLSTEQAEKQEIRWSKPKPTFGNRIAIKSLCGRFCITKEDGIYQPMKLKGAIWVKLKQSDDLKQAKKIVEEAVA